MRYQCIDRRRTSYPVRLMCRLLKVSPSGYYAWRSRAESTSQRWASDITFIWTGQGWLYLAVVMDLFSRRMAERNPVNSSRMKMWTYAALGQIESHSEMGQHLAGPGGFPFSLIAALNAGDDRALRQELDSLTAETAAASAMQEPLLKNFDSPGFVLNILKSIFDDRNVEWPSKYHDIALLAAFYGDSQLSLEAISYEVRRTTVRYGALWFPVMSNVRKLPGFKQLVTDVNLVEYWRAYGWADHCRAVGADDFECF